jgi:hypothetical protein
MLISVYLVHIYKYHIDQRNKEGITSIIRIRSSIIIRRRQRPVINKDITHRRIDPTALCIHGFGTYTREKGGRGSNGGRDIRTTYIVMDIK